MPEKGYKLACNPFFMAGNMKKKVLAQLCKEFWLPTGCALIWAAVNKPNGLKEAIPLFGAAFFFVAWISGNVFRVVKQTATESALGKAKSDIAQLLFDLREQTQNLAGLVNV